MKALCFSSAPNDWLTSVIFFIVLFQKWVLSLGGFGTGLPVLTQWEIVGGVNWEPSQFSQSPKCLALWWWRPPKGTSCSPPPLPTMAERLFWAKAEPRVANAHTLRETHGSFLSLSACRLHIFFSRLQHNNLRGMLHGVPVEWFFLTSGSSWVGMHCLSFTKLCLFLTSI